MFMVLSISIANTSSHIPCLLLSNQRCEIQPTVINLHTNEYSQELHYYPFAIKLDKCVGSCNTLNDLPNRICVPNKRKDLNIHVLIWLQGKMNQNFWQKIYHARLNVNFMEKM